MKNKKSYYWLWGLSLSIITMLNFPALGQTNKLIIQTDQGETTISRHIYGHFSEHLGRCIYGGIWVGEGSDIPNTLGYRQDVLDALKAINIPNLRWPGGCFADEYHWRDGIGPRDLRPTMINTHWGGVTEDNSFGTHEFLEYCEMLDTEPYICGNVGSGTVEEMSKWVEYINFGGESPMANQRRENGREEPWELKYWGVGNENWGCGGNMTAEYYADLYRRYATYCKNYGENRLYKVAGGANSWDLNWTEVLMKNIPLHLMNGISLHYYTITHNWQNKGSATDFTEKEYFKTISQALRMDELIRRHSNIMDRYDPQKKIGLIVDEWGTWYDVEPGTNPGFLYQQNTMRDALVAATTLNIFNKHAERVHMANLAQTVNVLQALVLTNDDKAILTPTYHVFDLYKVHQDATLLPSFMMSEQYQMEDQSLSSLHTSCSKTEDGTINISLVNIHAQDDLELICELRGIDDIASFTGRILTAPELNSHNSFEQPEQVKISEFDELRLKKNQAILNIPAKSIVVLQLRQ